MKEEISLNIEGLEDKHTLPLKLVVNSFPGTENVCVDLENETLTLDVTEDGIDKKRLIESLEQLGYRVKKDDDNEPVKISPRWFRTSNGKLVVFTGALISAASILWFFNPKIADYGFAIAALIALIPLAKKAVVSLRKGVPFTIETLVTVAVIGAILINQSMEAAVVVFLFAVGELLENLAVSSARNNIKALSKLLPKYTLLVKGETTREVLVESLVKTNIVEIRPGASVPADGEIVQGTTSIDESSITGESMPVRRTVGDMIFAGSINMDGVILMRVEKTSKDNMVARILNLVEEAEASKSPTARFIDKFSYYYTPGVMLAAILIAIIPPLLFGSLWMDWIYKGLAILLVGCPCALVLSTPAAITSGIASGARRGILLKGGVVLEAIGKVKTIAFDKTGTLTRGTPKVTDIKVFRGTEEEMLALAASVESSSSHPLAIAIMEAAKDRKIKVLGVIDAKSLSGRGMQSTVNGSLITVASPRYAEEISSINNDEKNILLGFEKQGKTLGLVIRNETLLGVIAMRDELRDDAKKSMEELKRLNIETVMLTGDNALTGRAIADQLGMTVEAELMPEDKLNIIEKLKEGGNVAMVGDGVNDAPALACATIGIAMGSGTDVALETADAALLHEHLLGVPALVKLSQATMRNIYQNISISLLLKAVFLVTTLFGVTSLWMAILADTGATVIVTLNALRLLRYDPYV